MFEATQDNVCLVERKFLAANFYVFVLNSVSVFYQLNQTGINEQKLPCTQNVGKLHWSPNSHGDVVFREGHGTVIGKLGLLLFIFVRIYC